MSDGINDCEKDMAFFSGERYPARQPITETESNAAIDKLCADHAAEIAQLKEPIKIVARWRPRYEGIKRKRLHGVSDAEDMQFAHLIEELSRAEGMVRGLLEKVGAQNELLLKAEGRAAEEGSRYDVLEEYVRKRTEGQESALRELREASEKVLLKSAQTKLVGQRLARAARAVYQNEWGGRQQLASTLEEEQVKEWLAK